MRHGGTPSAGKRSRAALSARAGLDMGPGRACEPSIKWGLRLTASRVKCEAGEGGVEPALPPMLTAHL